MNLKSSPCNPAMRTAIMLSRTSQDFHYQYYSCDGGETWTSPVQSPFHATTTMPTLLRLHDGRIICFWCNTRPLPELDHNTQLELSDDEKTGVWEDVFTNRDACHAAINIACNSRQILKSSFG